MIDDRNDLGAKIQYTDRIGDIAIAMRNLGYKILVLVVDG